MSWRDVIAKFKKKKKKNWNSSFAVVLFCLNGGNIQVSTQALTASRSLVWGLLLWLFFFFFAIILVAYYYAVDFFLHVCFCGMLVGNFSSDLHSKIAPVNYLK